MLNNSRVGGLWRVDAEHRGHHADPGPGGPAVTGGDGLELRGPTLYNVRGTGQNEVAVVLLRRSGPGWRATWQGAADGADAGRPLDRDRSPAAALWAVNARFGTPTPATTPYWITRLPGAVASALSRG